MDAQKNVQHDLRKKDQKVLFYIHQCVDVNVFEKIVDLMTAKAAWDTLSEDDSESKVEYDFEYELESKDESESKDSEEESESESSKHESESEDDYEAEDESHLEGDSKDEEDSRGGSDSEGESDSDPDSDDDTEPGGNPIFRDRASEGRAYEGGASEGGPTSEDGQAFDIFPKSEGDSEQGHRPQRIRQIPIRFTEFDMLQDIEVDFEGEVVQCAMLVDSELVSVEEALKKKVWLKPMKEELEFLKRFELLNCKAVVTPSETNHKLDSDHEGDDINATTFKQLFRS
ncbi:ribosome biogenesis protein ERB1-like [Lathyrus oleraceus]|uniref:ribosome biogenesis protein ERB1-like n=1 Tax=Pisum sativum TaxID=3888 RepID=UPI0021D02E45|nr:ribosome biogenesis protein ERB1-like [Pisum sativum]